MAPLNYYVSLLLRRRLPVLLVGIVIGAVAGWLTTPDAKATTEATATPYRATHTLVASGSRDAVNLQQLGFFMLLGEVPQSVAADFDVEVPELTSQLQITTRDDVQAIQVSAYDTDGDRAAAIANGFANALIGKLDADRQQRLDELESRADALQAELAAVPAGPGGDVTRQQLAADLAIANDLLRTAAGERAPLSTLEAAQPVPISQAAFVAALDRIRAGGALLSLTDAQGSGLNLSTSPAATATSTSDEPSPAPRIAVGALVGLIAAAALVIALDRLDPHVRSAEDVELVVGKPVLAAIPALERSQSGDQVVVVHRHPNSRVAEAFRTLRTSLAPPATSAGKRNTKPAAGASTTNGAGHTRPTGNVILVTSAEPGEGKTTTVVNLAAAFAEAGRRVLVIDADFRRPRAHVMLGGGAASTIADALWPAVRTPQTATALDFAALVSPTGVLGVGLMRAGNEGTVPLNPSRLLMTVVDACAWAAQHFDVVLVDSAAMLTVNDASDLVPAADSVVLLVRAGSSTRPAIGQTADLLERLDAPLSGCVLIGASSPRVARRHDFTSKSDKSAGASARQAQTLGL